MGNIGSQTGHISQRTTTEEQWAHSFPRTQPPRINYQHQHKVLPERDARQKLRPTNNGEILHSGGTLSGRQNKLPQERNVSLSKIVNCFIYWCFRASMVTAVARSTAPHFGHTSPTNGIPFISRDSKCHIGIIKKFFTNRYIIISYNECNKYQGTNLAIICLLFFTDEIVYIRTRP